MMQRTSPQRAAILGSILVAVLSGVARAGVNQNSREPSDDGFLSARELSSLDLTGTKLAVTSACDSAIGSEHPGDAILGIRRGVDRKNKPRIR